MPDAARTFWRFAISGSLVYGRGSALDTGLYAKKCAVRNVLLVTDANLVRLGIAARVARSLESSGIHVTLFDGCVAEPPVEIALDASSIGQAAGVDGVVGLGGGSNLDVAKIVAAVLTHGGEPRDYFGFDRVPGPIMFSASIPTTAGTGSEVSHAAVLTDREQGAKVSSLSQWLRPTIAIVDPSLTDSCPARVTAHSGIDALVHAIEAVTARPFSRMVDVDPQARAYEGSYALTELLAGDAIRRIGGNLRTAFDQPGNRDARDEMALAATLAGMAFSNSGVALVHALEYPLGAITHCSHGEGNGLLLPHVMRFNLPAARSSFAKIAGWLGVADCSASDEQNALAAIAHIEELQRAVGIRERLRDLGLSRQLIPQVAAKAFQIKRLMETNPRSPTEADLIDILESAY